MKLKLAALLITLSSLAACSARTDVQSTATPSAGGEQTLASRVADCEAAIRGAADARATESRCGWFNVDVANYWQRPRVEFMPWPPPEPSGMADITGRFQVRARYFDVASQIARILQARAYPRLHFFSVQGGFAVTTQLERFEPDGRPAEAGRFSVAEVGGWAGIGPYVRRLVLGERGRFRVLVFVVTNQSFEPARFSASESHVRSWENTGTHTLPQEIGQARVPASTHVTLMVYEFDGGRGRSREVRPTQERTGISAHRRYLGV